MLFSFLEGTTLAIDPVECGDFPRKYRKSNSVSGSAQPTVSQIKHLKKIGVRYIVDLRQEPHFFVVTKKNCETSVDTWSTLHLLTKDFSAEKIFDYESKLIEHLKTKKILRLQKIITKSAKDDRVTTKNHMINDVDLIMSEQQLCTSIGLAYKRIAATDHAFPSPQALDDFLNWHKRIDKTKHIHVHCRGGAGRTSTFMVICEMLQHRKAKTFDQYIKENIDLSGYNLIPNVLHKHRRKYPGIQYRYKMLKLFYEYVGEDLKTPWSKWLATKGF